jgi:hypothetical protein
MPSAFPVRPFLPFVYSAETALPSAEPISMQRTQEIASTTGTVPPEAAAGEHSRLWRAGEAAHVQGRIGQRPRAR